jgi:D-lactate dehydrogenase (cytochrome)
MQRAENSESVVNSRAVALDILKQRFGERFSIGQSQREQHAHTTTYLSPELPDAVMFVQSTEEVATIVGICRDYNVPVIAFGTGTSLEGGVNAPRGGISIDLSGMDRVLRVNPDDLDCVVEAGLTHRSLNRHLRDQGVFFPIDPGADASLGGMASTRASGTNAVRYGTMRDNVLGVTAVMANGEIVKTGSRARKSAAGYDLTGLLVGSEGTLGIITELTLKLHGIPEAIAAAICSFETVEQACNATIQARQMGVPLARIELIDAWSVKAINQYSGLSIPEKPLLLLEFHGSSSGVGEQSELFGEIASEHGGSGFEWVRETEARNRLWRARHDAYWAVRASFPGMDAISTDVCVPISRLAECVRETQADLEQLGLSGPIVGHVGDGNFHTLICFDSSDSVVVKKVEEACDRLARRALAMEGTCTGEHGIGQGKKKFMQAEHGPGWQLMRTIKNAIDPQDIMNPGKVIADKAID